MLFKVQIALQKLGNQGAASGALGGLFGSAINGALGAEGFWKWLGTS